jgi:rRNA maturation protein Nop10
MYCRACNFDLRGLTSNVCPECGRAFDPTHPATFLWRPRSRWPRLLLRIGAGVALVLLLSCVGAIAVPMWQRRPIRFESARWISTPAAFDHTSIRQRMVDDLLRSRRLAGMSRKDVEALLGPPDNTGYFREFEMVYFLGQEREALFQIDSEWLLIKLDADERVTQARLGTD